MEDKLREVLERLKQKEDPNAETKSKPTGRPKGVEEKPVFTEQPIETPEIAKEPTQTEQPPQLPEQPKVAQEEPILPQETNKEDVSPTKEPIKTDEQKQAEINEMLMQKINHLQNNGVFRLELLGRLTEINEGINLLTGTIMKALNIEEIKE